MDCSARIKFLVRSLVGTAALGAAIAVSGGMANAQSFTEYYSRTAFLAALGSTTPYVETFNDNVFDFGVTINSQSVSASEATGVTGGRFNDKVQPQVNALVVGTLQAPRTTTVNFSSLTNTYAWGADFDLTPGGQGSGIYTTLNLVGGGSLSDAGVDIDYSTFGGTGIGFYGVIVSGGTLSSVTLGGGPTQALGALTGSEVENYAMDNMIVVVPEANTLTLLGGAVLPLAGLVLRKRRK